MTRQPILITDAGCHRRSGLLRWHYALKVMIWLVVTGWASGSWAQFDIKFPQPSPELRITGDADQIQRWRQGSWDVFYLKGQVNLQQGSVVMTSGECIVWVETPAGDTAATVLIYMENSVVVQVPGQSPQDPPNRFQDEQWLGRMRTRAGVQFNDFVQEISPDNAPAIFDRGLQLREQELQQIRQAQYVISPITGQVQEVLPPTPDNSQSFAPPPAGMVLGAPANNNVMSPMPTPRVPAAVGNVATNVNIMPKNMKLGGSVNRQKGTQPGEYIYTNTGGTQITVDSTELGQLDQMGQPRNSRLVIQADNIVAWQNPVIQLNGSTGSRWEIYLEGNIVFAQGNRVIYAERMYYDVLSRRGTILNAEVLTPVPSYKGLLRLKADVVQQTDDNNLQAYGAAITSSRLGMPRYWLQADQLSVSRTPQASVDPVSGLPLVDPATGQQIGDDYFVESRSNRVYVGGVPVFFWPTLRSDLNNPNYYIDRVRFGNDQIFGIQLGLGLDLFQLLGIRNRPENARWVANADYLSERGIGIGTDADYSGPSLLGRPGETDSFLRSWFINDSGLDNLGLDRRAVPLDQEFRGRLLWRHHKTWGPGHHLRAELGWLSDQNFLQQYYERDWDQDKDYTTGLWLQRNFNTQSLNLIADYRINDFFTQTDWLPRFDHYVIGQPVLFDRAVWHGKTTIGYGRFRTANPPTNAVDLAKWDPLAWETDPITFAGVDRQGIVTGTRQELDFPFQLGPGKVIPYVLGDASYWQQDLNSEELLRLLGQVGVRTSLPMWRVDPTIHNSILNLNGLAHKLTFETEFLYADSDQDLDRLPLYNPLDDDAQEFFRRRFAFDTFGITAGIGENTPLPFDERYFALRSGMQSNVTSPAMEIADDLMMFRTGIRNRWQTKRGLPGEARVIDWVTLDVQYNYYPDADRDNFGTRLACWTTTFAGMWGID